MAFNNNITPGAPPLLWSDVYDAFTKVNENFDILVATIGDGSGLTPISFESLDSGLKPTTDNLYDIGDITHKWRGIYAGEYTVVDPLNGLWAGNAQIKGIGFTVNLPANSTIGGDPITGIGTSLIIDPDKTFFKEIQVDNSLSVVATSFGDTVNLLSGSGISLTVNSGADSIEIDNTGVLTVSPGSGILVSTVSGVATVTNDGVRTLQSTTSLPSGRTAGAGINISATKGDNVRVTNTGVISISQGVGITVSTDTATGDVTITNSAPAVNAFTQIEVDGDTVNRLAADAVSDVLNINGGAGITLTKNVSTDTLTITVNPVFDLKGSVFGDDSTKIVDAVENKVYAQFFGNLTGNVTGNADTATTASKATTVTLVATNSTAASHFVTFVDTATGDENVRTDTSLTYNPSTNVLTAGTFSGILSGNVFTNLIDSADSSAIVVTPLTRFESDVIIENDLTVNNLTTISTLSATNTTVTGRLLVTGNTLSKAVQSEVTTINAATGVVVHNYALGSTFRHTSPAGNFTVNITNINLTTGYITQLRLIIVQGVTPRVPTAVQIDGAAQTLLWKDNLPPSGNASKRDVVLFTISNIGGSYIVLGELSTYG